MNSGRLKSGVASTYVTYFIQIAIGVLFTPVLIKSLGQSSYGVYQIAMSVVAYITILNFGIPHTYMRFFAVEKNKGECNKVKQLNATYLLVMGIIALIIFAVGLAISSLTDKFLGANLSQNEVALCKNAIILLSVNAAITVLSSAFEACFLAFERFSLNKIVNCIQYAVTSLVSLIALKMGHGLYSIIMITIAVTLIKLMFTMGYSVKKLEMRASFSGFDSRLLKVMLVYSSFLFVNLIADQMNWSIDRLLLGAMVGSQNAAVYGVSSQIHSMYMQLMIAVSAVFITRINNMVAEKANDVELSDLFINVGKIQFVLAGLVNIGFIFFGKHFIALWAGDGYENSYWVCVILMLSSTVLYIQNIGTEIQRAKNKHKQRALLYIGMCFLNLILSIVLINKYNEIGAALGTAASVVIGDGIVMNIYYKKKMNLDICRFWKEMLKISIAFVPAIFFGVLFVLLNNCVTFWECVPYVVMMVLVYGLSCFFVLLNKSQRDEINLKIKGFIKR